MKIKLEKSDDAPKCYPVETTELNRKIRCSICCQSSAQSKALSIIKTGSKPGPSELLVEKIVAREVEGEHIQYLVRWAGSPKSDTWETAEKLLKNQDLIAKFEQRLNANRRRGQGNLATVKSLTRTRSMARMELEQQRPPYKITGIALLDDGQLHFKVKWNRADLSEQIIPAKEVNEKWPQSAIKFYEDRTTWRNRVLPKETVDGNECERNDSEQMEEMYEGTESNWAYMVKGEDSDEGVELGERKEIKEEMGGSGKRVKRATKRD